LGAAFFLAAARFLGADFFLAARFLGAAFFLAAAFLRAGVLRLAAGIHVSLDALYRFHTDSLFSQTLLLPVSYKSCCNKPAHAVVYPDRVVRTSA
jgi:hypothetical protein